MSKETKALFLDSIEQLVIGRSKQWISIRAASVSAPLMLFLHGGPGTAQISFARKLQLSIDSDFIIVNWDQRGAGRSYSGDLRKSGLSLERMLSDSEEIIKYLLQRFGKSKLILVGHSWGSILGFEIVKRLPETISAYIGIGQVINMAKGEEISYLYTLSEAKRRNNLRALKQLTNIGHPPYRKVSDGGIQRHWLGKFGGITHDNSGILSIFKYFSFRDSGVMNLLKFFQGIMFSLKELEEEQMAISFEDLEWNSAIPCYMVCGRQDYNVPFELVEKWAIKNKDRNVELVWFDRSGHLANYEEPEKFSELCKHVKERLLITAT
jgi:pimeloyl-ACP methyl ester carboxylesterase